MKNHSDDSVLEISNRCVTIWELDTREGYEQQIFENYFKAGNYFQTRDEGAHATVKYFNLDVSH